MSGTNKTLTQDELQRKYQSLFDSIQPENPYTTFRRLAPRSRSEDFTEALSFEVYDPLWMLGRQWQFGHFQGNDCGSTVMTRITAVKRKVNGVSTGGRYKSFSLNRPLEYDVEKQNHEIDYQARIESAIFFMKKCRLQSWSPLFKELLAQFPLDPATPAPADAGEDLEGLVARSNDRLQRMERYYGKRIFDGYKLYLSDYIPQAATAGYDEKLAAYKEWFARKYLPLEKETGHCWNPEKLGYEVKMAVQDTVYKAEDYHTGRLSWYSFDMAPNDMDRLPAVSYDAKVLSYLPTRATFPGAPSSHLWEFEDARVSLGNYSNRQLSEIASAVMVKFVTMYTNDWQIVPLEAEMGTVLEIGDIEVRDCFGEVFHIANTPERVDANKPDVGFEKRWAMFSTVSADAYSTRNFRPDSGLLFPPSLNQTIEGPALEEVQFLRDEMANMMWGVETRVSDRCGGSMDGRSLSDRVLGLVKLDRPYGQKLDGSMLLSRITDAFDKKGKDLAARIVAESLDADSDGRVPDGSDYSYLFMNRVPVNWIPFIPQRMEGSIREIRFRRGRMPLWFNGEYHSVRPLSSLLKVERGGDGKVIPRFVNEEEVLGYGTKVVLNAQRTRWFDGSIFTWRGYTKKISGYQANSGLMFDKLLDNSDSKTVSLSSE